MIHSADRMFRLTVAMVFLGSLALLAYQQQLALTIAVLYFMASLASYIVYALDKSHAQGQRWRISEKTLLTLDFLGGWPGGLIAQSRLHHKNRKLSYQVRFWLMVVLNLAFLSAWQWPDFFKSFFS